MKVKKPLQRDGQFPQHPKPRRKREHSENREKAAAGGVSNKTDGQEGARSCEPYWPGKGVSIYSKQQKTTGRAVT